MKFSFNAHFGKVHLEQIVVELHGEKFTTTQKWRAWGVSFGRTLIGVTQSWRDYDDLGIKK